MPLVTRAKILCSVRGDSDVGEITLRMLQSLVPSRTIKHVYANSMLRANWHGYLGQFVLRFVQSFSELLAILL
jgi:hypothetical protein